MSAINVNILIHGLFFMTQEVNNLRIYAPNIPNHHFIGGIRGSRMELPTLLQPNPQDFTSWKLQGKTPDPDSDIDGSIMRFPISNIGGFEKPDDPQFFKGSILLPWPLRITGLRTGDIGTTFPCDTNKQIAQSILANARAKNSTTLGVVALLEYTLPALNQVGGVSPLNIHFYLQPGKEHGVTEVNDDLKAVKPCFTNKVGFDLLMLTGPQAPAPIPPSAHFEFGTLVEDEQSVPEERGRKCPDILIICKNDPLGAASAPGGGSQQAVSPANCPVFFVG